MMLRKGMKVKTRELGLVGNYMGKGKKGYCIKVKSRNRSIDVYTKTKPKIMKK